MGLGDEIMALGRAERLFEETGKPVAICNAGGYPRTHDAWLGNPAVDEKSDQRIDDGANVRPYIKEWHGRRIIFNMDYRPRAGRIWLNMSERKFARDLGLPEKFAIVAPFLKDSASVNKDWGVENWEAVIDGFPLPVYQLLPTRDTPVIKGAQGIYTPSWRQAAAVIAKARLVLCNEGGTHHMAASFRVPAVVVFGAFVPPQVTGYDFHRNISVETPEGYCGNFDTCKHCKKALASITVDMVKSAAEEMLC